MNIGFFCLRQLIAISCLLALTKVQSDAAPTATPSPVRERAKTPAISSPAPPRTIRPTADTVKRPGDVPSVQQPVIDPGQLLVFTNGEGLATSNMNTSGDVKPSLKSSADVSAAGCNLKWQIPTPALSDLKGTVQVVDPATGKSLNSFLVWIPAKQSAVTVAYKFPANAEAKSYTAAVFVSRGVSSSKVTLKNTGATAGTVKLPPPADLPADLEIVEIKTTQYGGKGWAYMHSNVAKIRNKGVGASKPCLLSLQGLHPLWDAGNNKTMEPTSGTQTVPAVLAGKEITFYFDCRFQPRSATINPDHKVLESSYENNTWTVDPANILPDKQSIQTPHHEKD